MLLCAQVSFGQGITMLRNLSSSSLLGTNEYRIMESVEMGGKLYFSTWSDRGTELWYTDGVVTAAIYEWPMADLKHDYALNKLYVLNNRLLFTGIDSAHGKELWTSDGTTAGTYILKDIYPGSGSAFRELGFSQSYNRENVLYDPFTELNSKMYFIAADSLYSNDLWESDGTEAGTKNLSLINASPGSGFGNQIGAYNGKLYLDAFYSNQDFGFYSSDGTIAGASELMHLVFLQDYFLYGGKLFFNRSGQRGFGVSDGTQTGTFFIDSNIACSADRVLFNNKLFFFNGKNTEQLYTSDGTKAGTWIVKDALPANRLSSRSLLTVQSHYPVVYKNSIYFCSTSGLWKSDGTSAGTQNIKSIHSPSTMLTEAGGRFYFRAQDTERVALFVSDGTATGTYEVVMPGATFVDSVVYGKPITAASSLGDIMMVYKNQLFFTAIYEAGVGKALYKIDLPTSVSNTSGATTASLIIAPNPTPGVVNIRYPKDAYINASACDVIGRTVYMQTVSAKGWDALNLAHLPPGNYFIRLNGNAPSISAPVVIER